MNKKTIAVCFLLTLAILIGIPESFAYPQNGGSCSSCHVMNAAQKEMAISTADINNNGDLIQENAQTGNTLRQMIGSIKTWLNLHTSLGTYHRTSLSV